MFDRTSSKELHRRLRNGLSSDARRAAERFGIDSDYVQNVRLLIKRLPNSGAQHIRVANQDENWLVSQYRWTREQLQHGTDLQAIRDVLAGCVHELDVEIAKSMAVEPVTPDVLVDLSKVEQFAGMQEDTATVEAVHLRTPGAYRQLADHCMRQVSELLRKAHVARVLSSRPTR
jgi:hypothetical protein